MSTYTIDASVRLYGIEVKVDSEDEAEEIVRDALYYWMDDTYVPLDPSEALACVDAISGDESYSPKSRRDSKGSSVSVKRGASATKSGKGRAPSNRTKGAWR